MNCIVDEIKSVIDEVKKNNNDQCHYALFPSLLNSLVTGFSIGCNNNRHAHQNLVLVLKWKFFFHLFSD